MLMCLVRMVCADVLDLDFEIGHLARETMVPRCGSKGGSSVESCLSVQFRHG